MCANALEASHASGTDKAVDARSFTVTMCRTAVAAVVDSGHLPTDVKALQALDEAEIELIRECLTQVQQALVQALTSEIGSKEQTAAFCRMEKDLPPH